MPAPKNLAGQKSGLLTAIRPVDRRGPTNGCIFWECKCECGATHYVNANALIFKHTKSCGCLRRKQHGKY